MRFFIRHVAALLLAFLPLMVPAAEGQEANAAPAPSTPFAALGTWNGAHVMAAFIRQYENDQKSHFINFTPLVGEQIPGFLSRHQCDVGMTLDSLLPEAKKKEAARFESRPVGHFVVAVIINAKNPVRAISLENLAKVFAGNINSWKDVGWPEGGDAIEPYRPPEISTEGTLFQRKVMGRLIYGDLRPGPPTGASPRKKPDTKAVSNGAKNAAVATVLPQEDKGKVQSSPEHEKKTDRGVIRAVAKDPNAIGFVLLPCNQSLDGRVRILGIAKDKKSTPVLPTVATVADGAYPLVDTLTLHLHPKAPQSARDFCKFAVGPEGAAIIKQGGLWPEYELKKGTIEVRMREVRAHRGIQIAVSGSPAWAGLMKDIGQEFSKADTAVEVQYHAGGQVEAVGQFVHGGELVLLDALLEDATVEKYDRPWRELQPRLVPIGCFAAAVVVHPSNPASELTFRQVHDILCGKLTRWGELAETDAPEPFMRGEDDKAEGGTSLPSPPAAAGGNGGGRKMDGKARNAPHVGHKPAQPPKAKQDPWAKRTIHLFGPPAEDPINQQVETQLQIGAEQATVSRKPDAAKVLAAVARDPAAIGVIDLAKLPADDVSVKVLAISLPDREALRPSRWQVPEGYVLARPVQLYVSERAGRSAKNLVELISSGQCAASIARVGLIPAALPPKKTGK